MGNSMRIGGLASGMDIDSIVEKLMQAEKAPLNKLYQKKQTYEWQRDAYRDVNKKIEAFREYAFKNMTSTSDQMLKKSVATTNSAVTANGTSAANGATLSIDSVTQLATATRRIGAITDSSINKSTQLKDLGGVTFTDGKASVEMLVKQTDGKMKDVKIELSETDTIEKALNKLSAGTGLSAFYDEKTNKISLTTAATGKGAQVFTDSVTGKTYAEKPAASEVDPSNLVTISNSSAIQVNEGMDFFAKLGFGSRTDLSHDILNNALNAGNINAQNAMLVVGGIEIERDSNNFNINGFDISLNEEYTGVKPITLTTNVDVENTYNKIKEFVDTYNGLIESLNSVVKETKYRDYPPLTEEQKKDMSEDEIKSWEVKSKSGTLKNDSIIRTTMDSIRSILYESGGSSNSLVNTLYNIGITTTANNNDGGKLEIKNEAALKAAIAADPDGVYKTFSNSTAGSEGIVNKLRDRLDATKTEIQAKAGSTLTLSDSTYSLGKNLTDVDKRIDVWKLKLENIENRYWSQFTAMEKAINKANEQSSLFTSGQ